MKTAKRLPILSALIVAVAVCTTNGPAFAHTVQFSEGWNVSGDLAGWTANTIAANLAVVDAGGNPGGFLFTSGNATGTLDIGASANKFMVPDVTGDFSGTRWVISFDLLFISGNFDNAWLRFRFQDSSHNGWVYSLTDDFPLGEWRHFTVTFDPAWNDSEARAAGWVTDREAISPTANPSEPWSQTMSDVFSTEIRVSTEGFSEAGIDNFRLNSVLSGSGTPTIDGVISPGEWDNAGFADFPVNLPEGGTTPGRVFAMNDASNLYLAIRFSRSIVDPGNTASFEFDNDHAGGARVIGDDVILFNPSANIGFLDEVRATAPPCPSGALCGFRDTDVGGTNDGAGAFGNDGTFTVYEFSHPLDSSDDANDFSLRAGDTVGFTLFIRMIAAGAEFPVGFGDTGFPTVCVSCPELFGDIVITPPVVQVAIDIKPGSDPNTINPANSGLVPVVILSTETFDATTVSPITVQFGPGGASLDHKLGHLKDVDSDGDLDLVLHFRTQEAGILCGDTEASLTGETFDGQPIQGADSIVTVGCT